MLWEILMGRHTKEALDIKLTKMEICESQYQEQIEIIDLLLSKQLDIILHQDQIKNLEANWRGVKKLIEDQGEDFNIKLKLLSLTKTQLQQSTLHLKRIIYDNELGSPGGEPYSVLIGSYSFNHSTQDVELLHKIGKIAEMSFCPWVSSIDKSLLSFETWSDINKPCALKQAFSGPQHLSWNTLREASYAKFIVMTLPKVLCRRPYLCNDDNDFIYCENIKTQDDYCWQNSAYGLASCMINAFHRDGWTTSIRGAENGGKLLRLPLTKALMPTETFISDRREQELSELGLLPLCHYKNTDYAVFFSAETIHKPKSYDDFKATQNAQIASRLPYVLASSRFAHYLKAIVRDKIGSFETAESIEQWLTRWISQYVNANSNSQQLKSKYPLAEADISVTEDPEQAGRYFATVWLKPWLQLESLSASIRLITSLTD